MSTYVYLTNRPSDISGYKLAAIGSRDIDATATPTTSKTNLEASGTDIAITDTSGGTELKWITPPFKAEVTIDKQFVFAFRGLESTSGGNAQWAVKLFSYGGGEEHAAFAVASFGTELDTSMRLDVKARINGTNSALAYGGTTIGVGDRLVIKPRLFNIGTMAAGNRAHFQYNGLAGGSGDTYLMFTDIFQTDQVQFPPPGPLGIGHLTRLREDLDALEDRIYSADASVRDVLNELQAQADTMGA